MKKLIYTTLALGAVLLAASCQKENTVNTPPVFTAYVDSDTKTVLNGEVSEWKRDDAIRILNGTNVGECAAIYTTKDNGTTASFTTETASFTGSQFIAMYPAAPAGSAWWNASSDKYVNNLWLTNSQKATPGSFDPSAHIAIAYTTDKTLKFKNVVALLKFKVSGTKAVNVSFSHDEGSYYMCGNFNYNAENNTVAFSESSYKLKEVSLKGAFAEGTDYYVAILPGEYSNFTLKINGVTKKTKTTASFKSNTIYDLGTLDASDVEYPEYEFGVVGSFNEWSNTSPIKMYDTNGDDWYEAKDLTFEEASAFKMTSVATPSWIGSPSDNKTLSENEEFILYSNNGGNGDKGNIKAPVGTWTIEAKTIASADWGKTIKIRIK